MRSHEEITNMKSHKEIKKLQLCLNSMLVPQDDPMYDPQVERELNLVLDYLDWVLGEEKPEGNHATNIFKIFNNFKNLLKVN